MITNILIQQFVSPLIALFNLLPTYTFPFAALTSAAQSVGSDMSFLNTFFPVTDVLEMVFLAYSVLLPIFAAYKISMWTYTHIPEILGIGPSGS